MTEAVKKDAQSVAERARNVIKDDFAAASNAIGRASGELDARVRKTDRETFSAAEEAARRTEEAGKIKSRSLVLIF